MIGDRKRPKKKKKKKGLWPQIILSQKGVFVYSEKRMSLSAT